jgi:hypothetical protein
MFSVAAFLTFFLQKFLPATGLFLLGLNIEVVFLNRHETSPKIPVFSGTQAF